MPLTVAGSVLKRRLFAGRVLIRCGRFVSLGKATPLAWLVRGYDLYRRTRLELILTIRDNLFSFLQSTIDQRLTTIDLCDLHRPHFGRFIL